MAISEYLTFWPLHNPIFLQGEPSLEGLQYYLQSSLKFMEVASLYEVRVAPFLHANLAQLAHVCFSISGRV
jgi:hypothetical protein